MTKDHLEDLVNDANDLDPKTPAAQRLYSDLFNEYYLKYESYPDRERGAWDELLEKRLEWMKFHGGVSAPQITALITKVKQRKEPSLGVRQVHFGQLRAAVTYQSAYTVHSVQKVAGKTVMEVAVMLAHGEIARDELTVKIFYAAGVWVTINNRSLAAHSLAAAIPIRMIPAMPTSDETNRLEEVEDLPTAPVHMRIETDRQRFEREGIELPQSAETMLPPSALPKDRTLPSPLLPLTPGPEDKRVLAVVKSILA